MATLLIILLAIALLVSLAMLKSKNKETEKKEIPTALKPEFRKELNSIHADLIRIGNRLKELSNAGMDLYESLPAGIKESERFQTLDDSNWLLRSAASSLSTAITDVERAME